MQTILRATSAVTHPAHRSLASPHHPTALDLQPESEPDEERRRGCEVVDHNARRAPCVGRYALDGSDPAARLTPSRLPIPYGTKTFCATLSCRVVFAFGLSDRL